MNITVFADHDLKHSLAGGANVNLQENLHRLASKFKIHLLCAWEPGLPEKETVHGIEIIRFKGNQATLRWKAASYYKKNLEKDTDLVWDEVDSSVPWFTSLFTKKPILMHCLHFQKSNFFQELPPWTALPAYILEPWFYRLYKNHTTLTISESTREDLLNIGFKPSNLHIVSPGLESKVILEESQAFKNKSKTPLIVSLSRLRAWKGVHFTLEAMKQVLSEIPETQLAIIGTGPYENELKKMANQLGIDQQVQFLGRLSEKDKMEWLCKAHVLTKTSGREGWGIDVLEANACGTPAVGWKVPGTQDSIQDKKTGYLVKYKDINELSKNIVKILKDSNLRENLAREGLRFCKQYTWDQSASKIEKICISLADKSHK